MCVRVCVWGGGGAGVSELFLLWFQIRNNFFFFGGGGGGGGGGTRVSELFLQRIQI